MSDPGETVKDLKKYVDYAQAGAKEISAAAKAAQKLEDKGATLDELQSVLKTMSWMSKVSTALQIASVGFAVVQIFLPVKTQEDLILEGIQDLKKSLDRLDKRIGREFERLAAIVKKSGGENSLVSHLLSVTTAHKKLESLATLRQRGADENDPVVVETLKELRAIESLSMDNALNAIEQYVAGTVLAKNVLALTYQLNFGDVCKVAEIGQYLSQHALMAVSAKASIRVLQEKKNAEDNGRTWTDADAAQLTTAIGTIPDTINTLKTISDACHEWSTKCLALKPRQENVERFIAEKKSEWAMDPNDFEGTSERFVAALSDQWPWLNFTTVSYRAVAGFAKHGWYAKGGSFGIVALKPGAAGNEDMTILTYFAPRTLDWLKKPIKTAETNTIGSTEIINKFMNIATLTDTPARGDDDVRTYFQYWPLVKIQNANAGTLTMMLLSGHIDAQAAETMKHGWDGEMLWASRIQKDLLTESDDPHKYSKENLRKCVGVCSQNLVVLNVPVQKVAEPNYSGSVNGQQYAKYYSGVMSMLVMEDAAFVKEMDRSTDGHIHDIPLD